MSQSIDEFRKLSVAERIQLVEDIWDSIAVDSPEAVPLTTAQREEIQRRLQAHDADPSTAEPWEQVRSELFKRNH
jgi:putative addiction module component (TIGR02574 family)